MTDRITAEDWMREAIEHVARKHGASDKYHETRTIAWIRLVGTHVRRSDASKVRVTAHNSDLLNGELLDHFYTSEVLQGASARQHWVEPDEPLYRKQSLAGFGNGDAADNQARHPRHPAASQSATRTSKASPVRGGNDEAVLFEPVHKSNDVAGDAR